MLSTLSHCIRRYADTPSTDRPPVRDHRLIERAREYLHAHPAENVLLACLARVAGISPYHLLRLFRSEVGLPPHRYHTHLRIARAKALLAQGLPIGRVAQATGFADQSHLTRHFKRLVRVTPSQCRGRQSKNVQDGIA